MADSPSCDVKSLSPLQLFERVTEQGEKVRALKAGKAPKVFEPILFQVRSVFKSAGEYDCSEIYFLL